VLAFVEEFFSEDYKVHWLVMEFAPNGDLFEQVAQVKRFTERQARHVFAQLALGVKHIHDVGVAHLDLSLENVLLDENYNVKISDFGVARPIPLHGLFPSLFIRSKPGYMAPEIIHRLPFNGRKADVFSLGVMLYCMIIGHKPFDIADRSQISYRLISSGRLVEYLQRSGTMLPLTPAAFDLLSRMLCPESSRITVEEILAHPFLQPL
jgi:serine/threonine protein kinase